MTESHGPDFVQYFSWFSQLGNGLRVTRDSCELGPRRDR